MKKFLSGFMAFALALSAAVTPLGSHFTTTVDKSQIVAKAEDSTNVIANFVGKYQQTSARNMLSLINDFRTGGSAWVWNESDTEKLPVTGLKEINYDYELEKVAMQRAAELVVLYNHTRPNGERCFTAYTDTYTNTYRGENIAIGTSDMTTQRAFDLWKEEEDMYSGQGHRRNMLSENFNAIGIAHVYYKGCHYWVQEFSSKVGSSVETPVNDNDTPMSVEIAASNINNPVIDMQYSSKEIEYQTSEALPTVSCTMKLADQWYAAPTLNFSVEPSWTITKGEDVINISGSSIYGKKAGEAEIVADCGALGSKTINITVNEPASILTGTVYYQQNLKDSTQVRFIAEVSLEDAQKAESGKYTINVGGNEISNDITTAYLSIKADGKIVRASEGKCFIVTPVIKNMESGNEVTAEFSFDLYKSPLTRTIVL